VYDRSSDPLEQPHRRVYHSTLGLRVIGNFCPGKRDMVPFRVGLIGFKQPQTTSDYTQSRVTTGNDTESFYRLPQNVIRLPQYVKPHRFSFKLDFRQAETKKTSKKIWQVVKRITISRCNLFHLISLRPRREIVNSAKIASPRPPKTHKEEEEEQASRIHPPPVPDCRSAMGIGCCRILQVVGFSDSTSARPRLL